MDHAERLAQVRQVQPLSHRLRQRFLGEQQAGPQGLLRHPHERRLLEAVGGGVLHEDLPARLGVAVFRNAFELGVLQLQPPFVLADAAVEEVLVPRVERFGKEPGVEPDDTHLAAGVGDQGLQAIAPARRTHVNDPCADGLVAPGHNPGDRHDVAAVHVLAREELERIANRPDAQFREQLRALRTHALQVLHAVAEFRHAREGTLPPGQGQGTAAACPEGGAGDAKNRYGSGDPPRED